MQQFREDSLELKMKFNFISRAVCPNGAVPALTGVTLQLMSRNAGFSP
jgi:hypothetical protein